MAIEAGLPRFKVPQRIPHVPGNGYTYVRGHELQGTVRPYSRDAQDLFDFSHFAHQIPGCYYRLDTLKPGTSGDHHTPDLQAYDTAIPVGIRATAYLVWDYLEADLQRLAPGARNTRQGVGPK